MSSSQIFKLFQLVYKSRKYLLEMLEDRGYNITNYKNYNENEIKIMLNEHMIGKFEKKAELGPLDIILKKKNDENEEEKIYVKYLLEDKFKGTSSLTNQINEIYTTILNTKDTLIILNINRVLMKIGVKEKTDEDFVNYLYITKNYFVQLFGLENFLFNISKHILVPKHRILSKTESTQLLQTYNCSLKNLLSIKRDDPQAKYLGLKPKQICEILVKNVTSGITKKYRVCIL